MADMPSKKTAVAQTAKAAGMGSALLLAVTQLPMPYAQWVDWLLVACAIVGLVATQIPAPAAGSKLWPIYNAISFLAANWGHAANAAMLLRGKITAAPQSTPEPKVGPGSVVTIPKDETK